MNTQLPKQVFKDQELSSKIAVTVADAVLLLYKSVKERKLRELIKNMEDGGSIKYGKFTRNITL
ncbi:hypothetical protein HY384_01995 [Candidatus Daviesbacteria bacterium]|nr:hypothetical protein [Candidatus Daviesbacteria bacterium]